MNIRAVEWGDTEAIADVFLSAVSRMAFLRRLCSEAPFLGEPKPERMDAGLRARLADALEDAMLRADGSDAATRWEAQVERPRTKVEAWRRNPLLVVDFSFHEWRRASAAHRLLLSQVERDGVELVKA